MQVVLFNDVVDMFENDFIKGKTCFISNGITKQVNNFLNVHDSLELMLFVHSRKNVQKTPMVYPISHLHLEFFSL